MVANDELRRILNAQPLARMRCFAELLGWKGLRLEHHCLPDKEAVESGIPAGVIVFYMTTDLKFNLQINPFPHGQCRRYQATVKADRYGIVHVGRRQFELFDDEVRLRAEAERLKPWLYRAQFKNPHWRRRFIAEHSELPVIRKRRRKVRAAPSTEWGAVGTAVMPSASAQ